MQFSWDPAKAASNVQKHGVTFAEAQTACEDPHGEWLPDLAHGEARLNVLGMSAQGRVLFVVTVELDGDELRIISARKATAYERKRYEEG